MAKVRNFMSGLTHCIGSTLSLVGLIILIIFSSLNGDAFDIVSFTLYGTTLFLSYLFNTLYHWLNIKEKKLKFFKKFNNILFYVLIATSYTTLCLGPLRGPWGWSIFGVIWGISIVGVVFSSIWTKMPKAASIPINISLACVFVITLVPLIKIYNQANLLYSLYWLLISIFFYTTSFLINYFKWPKTKFKQFGFYEISHIIFIIGSVFQYWFILNYVTMF